MTELDKFKRRLVRSVSRLLKQDREQQNVAWEQMRKETGCDCKLLWERMRALTIKKIKRLLAAGDRAENIATVARLSLTDWLLFDLVLVHEKLDVIGREQSGKSQVDNPVLEDLFELVQEYGIESKGGEQLLEAWVALTRHYNSRGRQASPLLLQKRWYQLKENTRANFYKLWNSYRGNQKLWDVAKTYKPTPLQSEIAKTFPQVITQPFPEWKKLIEMQKVVLPEQFEMASRKKNAPKTVDDKPDLVVIEPVIETIELGDESDEDRNKNKDGNTQQEVNLALVKQEPLEVEDGLSNVQILDTAHVPPEHDDNSNSHLSSIDEVNRECLAQQMSNFMEDTHVEDAVICGIEFEETEDIELAAEISQDVEDDDDDLIKQKADEYLKSRRKTTESEVATAEIESAKEAEKIDDDIMDDIIKQKADDFVRKVDMKKLVHDVVDTFKLPEEIAGEMDFADDGIEFEDDGIEYVEEDDSGKENAEEKSTNQVVTEVKEEKEEEGSNSEEDIKEDAPSPKFDLKLLMEPVVYTTKLDDMIIFKGKKFDFVELQNVIDSIIIESKPVSSRAMKVENEDDVSQTNSSQADRSMNDDLFRNEIINDFNLNVSQNSVVLDKETTDSAPSSKETTNTVNVKTPINNTIPDDDDTNDLTRQSSDDACESDESIDESLKVKPNSCLLQKPRNRSYNPIILCKNPDFNTRLKRLTAGFFSLERNRKLFSACKPMTIDLHKAFETKLINGTLYLKSSVGTPQPVREEVDEVQSSSVMPSAMPIQSLLAKDQNKTNIHELLAPTIDTVDLTQRKKTVDLKDLSEIRRINQHLLTAEVPPMRVESSGFVINNPNRRSIETHFVEDDEEPKVTAISGGQDLKPHMSGQDTGDQQKIDVIPDSFRWPVRGRGSRGGYCRGRGRGAKTPSKAPTFRPQHIPTSIGGLSRTHAPWRLGPTPKPPNLDEYLITIDTLNRMINKLDGTEEYKNPKKKNKKPNWAIKKDVREPLTKSNSNEAPVPSEAAPINTIDVTAALNTPVPDVTENVSVETTPLPSAVVGSKDDGDKPKKPRIRRRKFCCWSREKLSRVEYGGTNTKPATWKKHTCPIVCECCCRDDLLHAIKKQRQKINNTSVDVVYRAPLNPTEKEDVAIVLSDGEIDDNNSAADDDSSDVRIPGFDPEEEVAPKPRLRVYSSTKTPSSDVKCSHTNSTCTSVCTGRGFPMSVAGVSTQTVSATVSRPASITTSAPEPSELQPVLRINVNFTPTPVNEVPVEPAVVIPAITTDVIPQTSLLEHIASQFGPATPAVVPALQNTSVPVPPLVPKTVKKVTVPVPVTQPTIPQRQIVIDASGGTTNIGTNKLEDKIMFLNSKTLARKPKESPIFLGKDTILLTTVKFPPNLGGANTEPLVQPLQPKLIPSLPLPSGVQLVLMHDGQLTYSVEPTAKLDDAQLAAMPSILAAVQEQINIATKQTETAALSFTDSISSSTSVVVSDKIDLTNNIIQSEEPTITVDSKPASSENITDNNQEISKEANNVESADKSNDALKDLTTSETFTEEEEELPTSDPNSSKDSEIISLVETDEPVTIGTSIASTSENKDVEPNEGSTSISIDNEVNDSASGSRNLLSDLMEMSGICAEDTKLLESPTKLAIPAGENTVNSAMKVVSTRGAVNTGNTVNLPELSPVTSLSELKYACENNGLFYKLDFNTGVIAPINVQIKKNVKSSYKTRVLRAPYYPAKGVIDLTDDNEMPKNITKDGKIKPIKLFTKENIDRPITILRKVSKPSILLKRENIFKRNTMPHDYEELINRTRIQKHKRKQSLLKVDARINLVDSDAPMEEEYLINSSDSDDEVPRNSKTSETKIIETRVIDSDDSSDEEPLAKKFMRLKQQNEADLEKISAPGSSYDQKNDVREPTESQTDPEDLPVPVGPPRPAVNAPAMHLPVPIAPKPAILAPAVPVAPRPVVLAPATMPVSIAPNPVPIAPKPAVMPAIKPVPVGPPKPTMLATATSFPVPVGTPEPAVLDATAGLPEDEESDDNMNSDDMEIEESQFMAYLEPEESQEEDCILGV